MSREGGEETNLTRHSFLGRPLLAVVKRFNENFAIGFSGHVECSGGSFALRFADVAFFGVPADIDGIEAPLSASFAGADWFAVYFDEDRVRVTSGEDPQGDPTRSLRGVRKLQVFDRTVGCHFDCLDRLSVHN